MIATPVASITKATITIVAGTSPKDKDTVLKEYLITDNGCLDQLLGQISNKDAIDIQGVGFLNVIQVLSYLVYSGMMEKWEKTLNIKCVRKPIDIDFYSNI